MVAVEHVLDLENAVNFDRHTSVLAPYCNCRGVRSSQTGYAYAKYAVSTQ